MNFQNNTTNTPIEQISSRLESVFNPESFRKLGHELIDLLANQIENSQSESAGKVLNYEAPDQQLAFWEADFKENGAMSQFFQQVLDRSIQVHHPKYIGHQVACTSIGWKSGRSSFRSAKQWYRSL